MMNAWTIEKPSTSGDVKNEAGKVSIGIRQITGWTDGSGGFPARAGSPGGPKE
jgi:hypothetical protein